MANDIEISNDGTVLFQSYFSISECRAQDVYVGRVGRGGLRVNGFFDLITRDSFVGATGVGEASVSGVGTFGSPAYWSNRNLTVGDLGSGTLDILDGGEVDTSVLSRVDAGTVGSSTVNVRGAGSQWRAGELLVVGNHGLAYLNIEAGGIVADEDSVLGVEAGSEGGVTVAGAGSEWYHSNSLLVGLNGGGRLEIKEGGLVTNLGPCSLGELDPGADPNESGGIVTVTDAGSTWSIQDDLYIGNGGFGAAMEIENGGLVSNERAYVGNIDTSDGIVEVNGPGSMWINSISAYIGYEGVGNLAISGGGKVVSPSASLGYLPFSEGYASVGAGSTWEAQAVLEVGRQGTGRIEIAGGGTLTSGITNIGGNSEAATAADGSVYVTGSGSSWTSSGTVVVGYKHLGNLQIDSGGVVKSTGGRVGFLSGSEGTAMIDGSGSKWEITGTLTIGRTSNPGTGVMTIRNGGLVTVSGGTTVRLTGRLDGDGTLTGNVTNQGVVAPGNSPGTLHITGDYTQSSTGTLRIEIASASSYDVLDVTGSANLGGTLELAFLNGYLPAPTDTFNIFSAASRFGTFSNVSVNSPSGSGTFNVGYTSTGVTLSDFQPDSGSGLVAYWDAENGADDVTGNGHDGVFQGNAATAMSGPFGNAFTFDGSGDYIQIGDELDLGASDFTLSAWINGDPTMDAWARIFDKGYASAYSLGRRSSTGQIGFEFLASGSQGNSFATTSSLIDNTWHHVALVKSGTTVTIYADGVAQNTETVSGAAQDNALPLLIGFNPGEGSLGFWKGLLDELKIYNRALSASEIVALAANLPGDYNGDGIVDAGDYVRWRNHLGDADESGIRFNGDGGGVTIDDYTWWKQHYGTPGAGSGGLAHLTPGDSPGASYGVPEPAGGVLLALVLPFAACYRRRYA